MTPEEIKAQQDALLSKIKEQTTDLTKGLVDKIALKVLEDKLTAMEAKSTSLKDAEEFKTLVKELSDIALEVKALREEPKKEIQKSLSVVLKENKEKLKAIAKGNSGDEIVVKALVDRTDIANNQQAYDLPNIGQLATRKLSLYDLFPKINIGESNNNGTIRYYDWDSATTVRAAAAVAEGVAFAESTAKWAKGSVILQKIGDTIPVTDEFFEDEAMFASELDLFLQVNVALEIDRQLALGDGTSNTIVGLNASISAYTLPGTGSVVDPSIYDLIVKVSEDITTTGGAKYMPNFAVMNIADINRMKLKKDANNNYVLPPFVSRDGQMVASIVVIESNIITANTMVVGDSRFAKIYEKGGIVLSKGYSGTQFVEDEMTLKARKRIAFLIRNADAGGFLKVTDIDAALAALAIV